MAKLPIRSLSPLIQQQAPRYVRDGYQTFIAFLEAYYEWLEQSGQAQNAISNMLSYEDIDTTLEQFISHFQHQYLLNIPHNILADPRKIEHHIKTFYRARGSEKAYRFLFRILFNENVNFYYPSKDLLKASDGKWTLDKVMRTTSVNDTFLLTNHLITGVTSGATAAVESVIQLQFNNLIVSELLLSNITGIFIAGENITNAGLGITETSYQLLVGATITNPGTGYTVNDKLNVIGGGGVGAKASISQIGGFDIGRVVTAASNTITLADFANANNDFYNGMTITLTDGLGFNQEKIITAYNGTTKVATVDQIWTIIPDITTHYSIALGNIRTILIEDFGILFTSAPTLDLTAIGNQNATATATLGAIGTYPGRWLNNDSFCDSDKFIEDDVFYQAFSYVLRATESLNTYRDIVKKLLHPAGTVLFGQVDIETNLQVGPTWRTLERNKFKFAPYEKFALVYPPPNGPYWGNPFGRANTQIGFYMPFVLDRVINTPDERRNEVADPYLSIFTLSDVLPTPDVLTIYDMIQGADPQILYDRQTIFLPPRDGFLGNLFASDTFDPIYTPVGQHFSGNQFDSCAVVPVNAPAQTAMIVYQPSSLAARGSLVGCIDNDADIKVTGYSISIETDGRITFRAQKDNVSIVNNLTVSTIPAIAHSGLWQVATLRYVGNTLTGNINDNLFGVTANYGSNVDALPTNNDSFGWVIGNQGFVAPIDNQSLYAISIWGRTLGGFNRITTSTIIIDDTLFDEVEFDEAEFGGDIQINISEAFPSPNGGNPFVGNIAYTIIWKRALTDNELLQAYFFLKNNLISRGIILP